MNQSKSTERNPSPLPTGLDKNLLAYATAAGAAGVAMLACAVPAQAEVVFTKAHVKLPIARGLIQFDINGDGQPDFGLSAFGETHTCTPGRMPGNGKRDLGCPFNDGVAIVPSQPGNQVWQAVTSYGAKCAANVALGQKISGHRPFGTGRMVLGEHSGTSQGHYFCPWAVNPSPHPFMGVKFTDTAGAVHYGWISIKIIGSDIATVTGYAYETLPNQPIRAGSTTGPDQISGLHPVDASPNMPEPASLGRLAQGAAGLSAWRRRNPQTQSHTPTLVG